MANINYLYLKPYSRLLYLPSLISRQWQGARLQGIKILTLNIATGNYQEPMTNYFGNVCTHACFFAHNRRHMVHVDYEERVISIRKVPQGEEKSRYTAHTIIKSKRYIVSWSPHDQYVLSFERSAKKVPSTPIHVWDPHTGETVYIIRYEGAIKKAIWSPLGHYFALLEASGTIYLYQNIDLAALLASCGIVTDIVAKIASFIVEYPYFKFIKKFIKCLKPYFLTWSPCESYLAGEGARGLHVLDIFEEKSAIEISGNINGAFIMSTFEDISTMLNCLPKHSIFDERRLYLLQIVSKKLPKDLLEKLAKVDIVTRDFLGMQAFIDMIKAKVGHESPHNDIEYVFDKKDKTKMKELKKIILILEGYVITVPLLQREIDRLEQWAGIRRKTEKLKEIICIFLKTDFIIKMSITTAFGVTEIVRKEKKKIHYSKDGFSYQKKYFTYKGGDYEIQKIETQLKEGCAICKDHNPGDYLKKFRTKDCIHVFHAACLEGWMNAKNAPCAEDHMMLYMNFGK